jgi:beta-lactamase superfamily II metal-dependent hydrolase
VRGLEEPGNEGSRSVLVEHAGKRLVLFGDAEEDGLERILADERLEGPCDLLLFPHHGSETAHLCRLLDRVRPAQVLISSGTPPAVGPELDRRGLAWTWTGRDGPFRAVFPP